MDIKSKNRWVSMKSNADDPFEKWTVFVPKSIAKEMKKISIERDLPLSKLMVYAADNELDCEIPFNYQYPMPTTDFVNRAYVHEAGKIFDYLKKFPKGTGVDTLLLCRRDIGVLNKETFMLAYRELLDSELVEEFYPQETKFRYGKDYKYVKICEVQITRKALRKAKTQLGRGEQ